ncbi:trigger factor [Zhihengliuella somnathii]
MKSAVENLNPTRVKLNVEVPLAELQPGIDAAYKSISEQIQVPGFRKGKVPNQLIDQRVGRGYVIETAVNDSLNGFYQQAMTENDLTPISRPEVEINELPGLEKDAEGELKFSIEVDIRPQVELPEYAGIEVTVDAAEASDEDVAASLDELRGRFGTLKSVDRPAAQDDFLTIDMTASVDGEEVDSAADLSYQVGSGTMLDGLDEAVTGLSADEDAIFETKLAGGEHSGQDAQVKVVVKAVKERELPEANDEFAQLASEFDTIDELKADLAKQAADAKVTEQGVQARDLVLDKLVEMIEVPVPDSIVEEQVEQHFTQGEHSEGDEHDTEEHRAEVRANAGRAFQNEIILDAIAEKEEVGVEQSELIDYIVQTASQYGMDPNQFAQMLDGAGQVPMIVGEVRRRKALAKVLEVAKVTDSEGKEVDLSSFVKPQGEEEAAEAESSASSASSASADSAE